MTFPIDEIKACPKCGVDYCKAKICSACGVTLS